MRFLFPLTIVFGVVAMTALATIAGGKDTHADSLDAAATISPSTADFVPGELLVGFESGISRQRVEEISECVGATVIGLVADFPVGPVYEVGVPVGGELAFIPLFEAFDEVRYAEVNHIIIIDPVFFERISGQSSFVSVAPGDCPHVITIDVKPGSDENPINARSRGTTPVAILSGPDFDAAGELDQLSLTFGSTGVEESLASCRGGIEDVNGDGLPDQMCRFDTHEAEFQCGDAEGILRGQTTSGVPVRGVDTVSIVACR